jgi:steroid delta-isomerase-like uncharacterized protein
MTTKVTVAPGPGAEATLALARRFLNAVNTRNADALIETMADDAVYELHAAPATAVRGHAGIRQALATLAATFVDYDFTINTLFADTSMFVAEWTMTARLGQPMPVGNSVAIPDGRSIRFHGVDICPISNGKITLKSSYVDATAWYDNLTFQKS